MKKYTTSAIKCGILLVLTVCLMLCCAACGQSPQIRIEDDFADGTVIEYTGEPIQFPMACVQDQSGTIVSYDVRYQVISLADDSTVEDEYATFDLKTGEYQIKYTYMKDKSVSKTVNFSVQDTVSPSVEFLDIPNGLFLQNITEDTVNKLPLYSIEDASANDGIDLVCKLTFKGETDAQFREYPYRQINNSYEITEFGTFRYELTATDVYGNQTVEVAQWKVKDRQWQPAQMPDEGILADYSVEGYCNMVEGGDANQYYKIGNDYADEWLAEFQGAQGVLKVELPFNNAVGWGNNTVRLRVPKTFTQADLAGKYLAVRMYVEGAHLKPNFLFGGNNVQFWAEDATTRAFTTAITGLETGVWKTYYLEADMVEHIGMYPNATYNPNTTFYEGGDPADAIQLCFHREAGYFNDMVLYVDSISIADFLPDTELTVSGTQASWTPVAGAVGYRIDLNGTQSVTQETQIQLPGEKGFVRVTPMGNGVTTLDAQTVTGVYGLDAGDSLAKFDDALYVDLFSDILKFSTESEHNGYRPVSLSGMLLGEGVQMDIGTGSWGVVTGVRFLFPNARQKGNNTTMVLNMMVSNADYDQIRVYDYHGTLLGVLKLEDAHAGQFHQYELDISAYNRKLEGVQLIFGPNSSFSSVSGGVSVTFKEISLKNTYYPISVNGQSLMCAGNRKLIPGFSNKDLVQFTTFYNFGVGYSDTPLSFSGTVLVDGKRVQDGAMTVVGYPGTDTICFKVPHNGKILTIMKDSVIYYNGIAVKVEETFNAYWDGSKWVRIANIPSPPTTEYVTVSDGTSKVVENKGALEQGYTANGVVQFLNVHDFGVTADDTPLQFDGTVMLDGQILRSPQFVGYPKNTTIALKAPHQGKLLTIMQDSVIYYGDAAFVVTKTFNAKWDGSSWNAVSEIPPIPETQYITLDDGTTRELMATVTLTPGYTADTLVQFPDIYDFGAPADSTPIGFQGTVLLQGVKVENPAFNAYLNSTTVGLEKINHKGKVVTIVEGSYIYNDTAAVQVQTTFNAVWDGTSWTAVDEIPEPEAPKEGTVRFEYRYGAANVIQVNTNLPASIPCANFLTTDHGSNIDQSANQYQQVGWIGMTNADGVIVLSLNFNSNFSAGQTYFLPAGCVFGFADGSKFTLDQDYTFLYDGTVWTLNETPEPPVIEPTDPPTPEEGVLNLQYRYGTNNLIQVNTDLPATTPCVNFLTTDNGSNIDQSANLYQNIGWIAMEKVDGVIVLTFHFNGTFSAGQNYTLPAGAVFGFTDGSTYTLDEGYEFTFDGSSWSMTTTGEEEPPVIDPELPVLSFTMKGGSSKIIQVYTDLPETTPCADFTAEDNGCQIDETGNVQALKNIKMRLSDGQIYFMIWFNDAFKNGETYTLPAGSVFGFTDGSKYVLDKNYIFTYNDGWSMEVTEPAENTLGFQLRYGTANLIQLNTNLPKETPCVNFLTTDNGCVIDESANQYQRIGWIGMDQADGTVILTLHFNAAFKAAQTYFLSAGSIFGFTDGNSYVLDKDYTFTFDGSSWLVNET